MPTNPHPDDPAEGSPEAIDHQLKRSESSKNAKTVDDDGDSAARGHKPGRDIEEDYPLPQFIEKIRELADALEEGKRFQLQVAGEMVSIPADAVYNIEYEREGGEEEIEFKIKWSAK
ncbi:amphi-Trp domain-containing protein [Chelativorans sp. AA-79]|uniref:amphi-Trp domain-containing protein n=1 Tax=Chelativorans sp. AA-79 TaxID=3028735 RepID=UPI0023F9FD84|nr:amphi-Trp domain-containing protein [Chelativorans sp. AA-79]WEX07533.1 amphi-Trp domain-containing protein [Chelativorans sp. AA-79]